MHRIDWLQSALDEMNWRMFGRRRTEHCVRRLPQLPIPSTNNCKTIPSSKANLETGAIAFSSSLPWGSVSESMPSGGS